MERLGLCPVSQQTRDVETGPIGLRAVSEAVTLASYILNAHSLTASGCTHLSMPWIWLLTQ